MLKATYDSFGAPGRIRTDTVCGLSTSSLPLDYRGSASRIVSWLPSATVTTPSTTARQRRVVVAEDEALIRLDLKEMLEEEGYDVGGEAADGEQAVKLAQELKPDLVILDVKMPVLDGISAAEQIVA